MAEDLSVPPDYFRAMYAADPDPWRFASSDYERDKYAATLAAIGDAHVASALEIGCSIGIFTRALAPRCAALLAVDVAGAALAQARRRCAALPQVGLKEQALHLAAPSPNSYFTPHRSGNCDASFSNRARQVTQSFRYRVAPVQYAHL